MLGCCGLGMIVLVHLMVSIAEERVLGLGHIESPRSEAVVSSLVFRGSTVGLDLDTSNTTIMGGSRVVGGHIVGHGIRVRVGHSQSHGKAGQDNRDQCLVHFLIHSN